MGGRGRLEHILIQIRKSASQRHFYNHQAPQRTVWAGGLARL